ncbi:MAG: TadE/TadG family type IV pilus assembly protein [Phenylobacterium sp.]
MRNLRLPRLSRINLFTARFAREERGAVAVEVGLVLLLFVTLVFALIELAMVFLASASLETAVQVAGRQIRTGEFQQSASNSRVDFQKLVCANMGWLSSQCATDAFVEVQTFASFSDLAANPPLPAATFKPTTPATTPKTCFTAGNPTDIVLVRAYFRWRLFTPFLDHGLENIPGAGLRLMSSATAFRNEPYSEQPALGAKC